MLGIPSLVIRKLYIAKFRDQRFPDYPERERLRAQPREALSAQPKVAACLDAAEAQLARHRHGLEQAYGERLRLHTHAVVALGFERLVWRSTSGPPALAS